MTYLPSQISSSNDLAALLNNTQPLTPQDAAEGPLQWGGFALLGGDYEIDTAASSDTRCVLKDGNVAVTLTDGAWAAADTDSWTWAHDVRGVTRDWRSVTVWDANGFLETDVHATLDDAKSAFDAAVTQLRTSSSPQATADTVYQLLAADEDTSLAVTGDPDSPKLIVLDSDDLGADSDPDGDPEREAEAVISRADLIAEVGEDPSGERIAAYLPKLQGYIDTAAEQR